MLTQRRADILQLVINEYIDTAMPVSSRALVDRHGLGVSTATVRNELAHLEEAGYITHPYTSAGRIPSDLGYRLYIEELMSEEPVEPEESRTIQHQFHQVPPGVDEWLGLAASVLAGAVGNVAVVAKPRRGLARLRHAQLIELRSGSALLVMVMDDGAVRERIVPVDPDDSRETLSLRTARVNQLCAGQTGSSARAVASDFVDPVDARLAALIADVIDDHTHDVEVFVEGVRMALGQPEFATADRMLDAVHHLGAYELQRVLPWLATRSAPGDPKVTIGQENPDEWLQDWSVVVANFRDRHGSAGAIAVLGPTRMRYRRTIPRVRYLARLMTALLEQAS